MFEDGLPPDLKPPEIDELIGVLVTVVENVATLSREHVEPPLLGSDAGATVGIARVGNQPTVLLDANALFLP